VTLNAVSFILLDGPVATMAGASIVADMKWLPKKEGGCEYFE
jgi:hypothetical protein